MPAPPPPPAPIDASIETAAKAAIAAAILPPASGEDVTIRPLTPKPTLFIDPAASRPEAQEPEAFIPPQADRPPSRGPRMPRIDELPVPAQNEIRARRGELTEEHPDKRRKSLLERLASVGLGRREPEKEETPPARMATPMPTERLAGRPLPRTADPRPEPVSEYAKRQAPQGLDQHGRQAPVHNQGEEDQLDIPAFLRRQAN
jgi:cell division protein FtsZ